MAEIGTKAGATLIAAVESSYGMPDATNAWAIDTDGVAGLSNQRSVRILASSWNNAAGALKMGIVDNAEIAWRGGTPPPHVAAVIDDDGKPAKQVSGDLTLEFIAVGSGENYATSTFLGMLLSSSLACRSASPGTVATATYATANVFSLSSVAGLVVGEVVAMEQPDQTLRYLHVSTIDTGAKTVTTVEPHGIPGPAGTATMHYCSQWYQPVDGDPGAASLAIQLAGRDEAFTTLAVGCRLKSIEITAADGMQLRCSAVVSCPDGLYASAAIMPQTQGLPGGVAGCVPLSTRPAPCIVSEDHSEDSAPWYGTASTLRAATWSARVDVSLEPITDQGRRSGVSGHSVTSAMASGSLTQAAPTSGIDFREVLRLGEAHTMSLSASGARGATGAGLAMWVGCVQPTADPGVTHEDTRRTQVVPWRAGDYAGDSPPEGGHEIANAPWILAMVA